MPVAFEASVSTFVMMRAARVGVLKYGNSGAMGANALLSTRIGALMSRGRFDPGLTPGSTARKCSRGISRESEKTEARFPRFEVGDAPELAGLQPASQSRMSGGGILNIATVRHGLEQVVTDGVAPLS